MLRKVYKYLNYDYPQTNHRIFFLPIKKKINKQNLRNTIFDMDATWSCGLIFFFAPTLTFNLKMSSLIGYKRMRPTKFYFVADDSNKKKKEVTGSNVKLRLLNFWLQFYVAFVLKINFFKFHNFLVYHFFKW